MVLKRYAYADDPAGNRTVEQIDDAITLSAYDNLNRLTSQAPGGPMIVAGSLNEPGTVTISGLRGVVDANNNFRGTVPTTSATNTFTIVAQDASGNTLTQQYEVQVGSSSKTLTYDANGNLAADGTQIWNYVDGTGTPKVRVYQWLGYLAQQGRRCREAWNTLHDAGDLVGGHPRR